MYELDIYCTSVQTETISEQLETAGALAITWRNAGDIAIYEPKPGEVIIWPDVIITAIYESETAAQQAQELIHCWDAELQCFSRELQEKDWIRENLASFQPIAITPKLWICPSWLTPNASNATHIMLDPGLAFGTGSHGTTALCLRWLAEHLHGNEIVVDYGCGSGILAIAAAKLGAAQVYAVDYDEQALLASKENQYLNAVTDDTMQVLLPTAFSAAVKADVIVANILATTIIELLPTFTTHLKKDGKLVLSGILREQESLVLAALASDYAAPVVTYQDEWLCIATALKSF